MHNNLLASVESCIQSCLNTPGNTPGECNTGCGGGNVAPGITNPGLGSTLQNLLKSSGGVGFVQQLVPSLIGLAFVVGVIVFFFMIIISGIQWITSGGDKGAVEGARGRLTQALIGIIILFSTFAIVKLIEHFFGISILALDIGPLLIK